MTAGYPAREHSRASGRGDLGRQPAQKPPRQDPFLRVLGSVAAALTLAAVLANVVWFARRGLGPLKLLAIAGPLWLAVAAVIAGAALGAWLVGRLLAAREREP